MKGLIITYILTYGGALAGIFNPYVGLLVYVAFSIIKPTSMWYWSVPPAPYSKIIAAGFLLGWLLRGFGNWNFRRGGAIALSLAAYWIWTLVGFCVAPDKDLAERYFGEISKIVIPFFVGMTTIDSVRKLKQLPWVIVCCQGYVALEMNLSYLGGFNRLHEVGFGDMDNNCNAIAFVTCLGLAMFLVLSADRWWQRGAALGFALTLAHAIFLSFSRGAMLAMIVTGGATFFLIPKKPRHYLFLVLAILVALRMAGKEVQERFSSSFEDRTETIADSATARLLHWKACLQSIAENPILGVGPAHWRLTAPRYGLPRMEAHTLWLQVTAEQGIPGVLFLALFYLICYKRLWPLTRERYPVSDPWFHDAARMVMAALTGFIVSAQFVSLQGLEVPYYICMLGACVLKIVSQAEATRTTCTIPSQHFTPATRFSWNSEPGMTYASTGR